MSATDGVDQSVGPVLQATPFGRLIVSVIESENEGVSVHDEGAYLRVAAPRTCRLSRRGLETATGTAVQFPGDLEFEMSSFTGMLEVTEDAAVWRLAGEAARPPTETTG